MERSEVDVKYTWDLTKFYKTDNDWYKDYNKLKKYVGSFQKYKGKLNNVDVLIEMLEHSKQCDLLLTRLYMYASNNLNTELSSKTYNEMVGQLMSVLTKIQTEESFVDPELLGYSEDYLKSLQKEPRLKNYKFMFKNLMRDKKHVLSEKEEKLLSGVQNFAGDSGDVFDSLTDVDFKFADAIDENGEKHELTNANYSLLLKSKDRVLRESAYKNFYGKFKEFNNTIFVNYQANLKSDYFFSTARHHKDTFESALYGSNISPKLYNKLLAETRKTLPVLEKYYNLRKKALGYENLTFYDLGVSMCKVPDKKYTYEEAQSIVLDALKPLGLKYNMLLNKAYKERWIDVYPTKDKISGGYQTDGYGFTPIILLNFVGVIDDVFTLAHELGHAMHTYFAQENQPYETYSYSIFLAEIASTFNEVLLTKHFLKNAETDDEKLYYLDKYIKLIISTVFSQMQYSEFEQYAHNLVAKNLPISKEALNQKYADLNSEYFKGVCQDDFKSYHWSIVPHFYRSFYVYKYASGLISAIALANKVLNGTEEDLTRYFKMLSSGGSDYSTNILKRAGVDLTTDEPYNIAFGELKDAIEQMEKIINKG